MIKHYITLLIILGGVTAGHVSILKAQAEAGRTNPPQDVLVVPSVIGPYQQVGEDIDAGDNVRRVLQTSTILIRNYEAQSGWPVQLSIVYAGATRRSLHFPEVCLVGAGWEISRQESTSIGVLFDARRLLLVKGGERQAVVYWFKTEDQLTANYFVNAWYWARNQFLLRAPTSAMIRLATPVSVPGAQGEEMAFALLEDFAAKFMPVLMDHVD